MNDTSEKVDAYFRGLLMKKSPQERLRMGCSMFDTAKAIVRSSILERNPKSSSRKIKREIFLRFYGQDFQQEQRRKILETLK